VPVVAAVEQRGSKISNCLLPGRYPWHKRFFKGLNKQLTPFNKRVGAAALLMEIKKERGAGRA